MELDFKDLLSGNPKTKKSRGIILSERDLSILLFLLDMKFASIKDIFEKFFSVTLEGEVAKSNVWTIGRLQQLEKAGLIKSVHSFSDRRKYFMATVKAYRVVSERMDLDLISKPLNTIDLNTFEHDKAVLESRIILENKRAATCWISDRQLRSSAELAGGLTAKYIPDGIYTNIENVRVAIEIEIAIKSRSRYQDKIKKYLQVMRSQNVKHKTFDRVLYICDRERTVEYLRKETKIYGDLFEIKSYKDFFGKSRISGLFPKRSSKSGSKRTVLVKKVLDEDLEPFPEN